MPFHCLFKELSDTILVLFDYYRKRLTHIRVTTKDDSTLLTEADVEIEKSISRILRSHDPACNIIAEEGVFERKVIGSDGMFWVIDPIDGTSEFCNPDGREFCSVIVRFEKFCPVAALLIAPELKHGRDPLVCEVYVNKKRVVLNGNIISLPQRDYSAPKRISATRSRGVPKRDFEGRFSTIDAAIKIRTTSQSLDQLRLIVDLEPYDCKEWPTFDLFVREKQKLWDGAGGLCFTELACYKNTDLEQNRLLPLQEAFVNSPVPCFDSVAMGPHKYVDWFFGLG